MEKRHITIRIEEIRYKIADLMTDISFSIEDGLTYTDPLWDVYNKLDEADDLLSDADAINAELMNAEGGIA